MAEISRMRNETGTTSRPTMPGSSNDHLIGSRENETNERMDEESEATSVAIDVVSNATHDGSVKVISLPSDGEGSDGSEESGGETDYENCPEINEETRGRSRNPGSDESNRSRS